MRTCCCVFKFNTSLICDSLMQKHLRCRLIKWLRFKIVHLRLPAWNNQVNSLKKILESILNDRNKNLFTIKPLLSSAVYKERVPGGGNLTLTPQNCQSHCVPLWAKYKKKALCPTKERRKKTHSHFWSSLFLYRLPAGTWFTSHHSILPDLNLYLV